MIKDYLPFWDKLSKIQQNELRSNSITTHYDSGDHVHEGDSECIGIVILVSGSLRTYMLSEDGREITLFRMTEGDVCVLSASCILDAVTFDVHIDAEGPAEVIRINSAYWQALSSENVYVENFMYKIAMERFSQVMWVMEQVLFMSMDKRLAIFLLDEGPVIKMTHERIAKHMGTAREVITRMLKYFYSEGYVELSRGTVTITNRKALLKLI